MFCNSFHCRLHKKIEYTEMLEYTQVQQTVGTPAFRRAFTNTALSLHDPVDERNATPALRRARE
jgi:hypothetical protein